MPEVPIEIANLYGNAGFREGIINGNIEGSVKAGVTVNAHVCHGINLGLDGEIIGQILGNMDVLFIGTQAKGSVSAAAGARALVRLEPNLLEKLGLSIYLGAYARAMASGSLAIYLTPEFFSQQIQNHLDDFTTDIFLIFLEEVKAEVGVWGRIAFSAMAEGNVNIVCDIKKLSAGFEISGGYKYGLKAGAGYDFYCDVGFKDLRRAVNRSSIRVSSEIKKCILKSDVSNKYLLAECFDFSFPLLVLISYDLGHKSVERGEFISKEEVAGVVFTNFIANLQRYAVDKIIESAVSSLTNEFSKIYYKVFNIQLGDPEKTELDESINRLVDTLRKDDMRLTDLNVFITEAFNIIDILDSGALDDFKRPLTLFWVGSIIGFEIKQLLNLYSTESGIGSTILGEARTSIQYSNLPSAPEFIKEEISLALNESVIEVDIRLSVDYLMKVGISNVTNQIFPELEDFKYYFESHFDLTFGEIFEDALRGLKGEGHLSTYHSYQAIKSLVKTQFVEQLIMGELLPQITDDIGNEYLYQYTEEVIRPSTYLVSEFVFKKLDNFLIEDLNGVTNLPQFVNGISSGCGVVVYTVLARNIAFFDQIINDFILDYTYQCFDYMGTRLNNPQDPFFIHSKNLLSQNFPHITNLDDHVEALRQLLLDLTYAFKETSGPTIFTSERRNNMRVLKRDILLSMAGNIDYSESPDPYIERLLDCGFIPNIELVKELGNLLLKINVEAFSVFIEKIIPALGDFFLTLSLPALSKLKSDLLSYIKQLSFLAKKALNEYNELSDYIDRHIIDILNGIDTQVTHFKTAFKEHLDTWGDLIKATIHYQHLELIKQTIPAGAARDAVILTFENTTWPVESVILETAITTGNTTLKNSVNAIVDHVDEATDIAEAMIALKQSVEDAINDGLIDFVLKPIDETTNELVNALIPDSMLIKIEEYLMARRDKKELERQQLEQEQELAFLEAEKNRTKNKYDRNNFNSLVILEVSGPVKGFPFIYPKEVTLHMRLKNGNHDMVSDPSSRRIQVTLNSIPITLSASNWTQSGNDMVLEKLLDETEDGLNILEVSWIKSESDDGTVRETIPFVVNAECDYKMANFDVSIDSDPEGPDVEAEHVEFIYRGSSDLEVQGWLLQDKAGHKYALPQFTLCPDDLLKIYTGGNINLNKVNKTRKNKLLFMGRKKAVWNNEGDTMYLTDMGNVLIYQYSYLQE